jgi:hypothetical protein
VPKLFRAFLVLALAVPLFAAAGASYAEEKPDATLTFKATDLGYLFRVEWGNGRLSFPDGTHRQISVKGGTVLGAGVSVISATGKVFNLKNLEDFNGSYTHADAGIAVIEGKKVSIMQNAKGVTIHLVAHQEGLQLSLGVGGMEFELK